MPQYRSQWETQIGAAVTLSVTYGGTATGANDPTAGDYDNDAVTSVTFSATATTMNIEIPITDDFVDENDETFTVTIALSSGTLPSVLTGQCDDHGDDTGQ